MKPGIKLKPATVFATVVGILYPFAVYFGLQVSTPLVVVLCLLTFLCFRIFLKWRETTRKIELIALSVTFICVAGLLLIDQMLAIKVYPVAISLSLAALFIYSFFFPPTVIERFARMSEPTLNKSGVRYTRKVTIIWIVFFICNAAASLMTALWGNLEIWAFYNGFLSYVFVGGLMAGEFVVRQFVKKYHHGENE